jgi:hypothetical protein
MLKNKEKDRADDRGAGQIQPRRDVGEGQRVNVISRKRKYTKYLIDSCAHRDFGGIFAELLPGNVAKLHPPDGQDLMDDLEIKVQLDNVWKQSLTELSGANGAHLTA